ncbi:MAG: FeoA domain-containing protein [Armatimonadetes bacterium]|nr:FeoA domain-containing protein [Armatimonadota bacterium]
METMLPALLFGLTLAGLVWYGRAFVTRWLQQRWLASREAMEDSLMFLHHRQLEGRPATLESLAAGLDVEADLAQKLAARLREQGLLEPEGDGILLTGGGLRLAVQVIRAHRLFERYLADETSVPMEEIHRRAHKLEHTLSPEDLNRLDAYMGHPASDPHGDAIPDAAGEIPHVESHLILEWPVGKPARIVHIEDEPPDLYAQIVAEGLAPGMVVEVVESTEQRIVLESELEEHVLAPAVAAHISVCEAVPSAGPAAIPLSSLKIGERRRVVGLDSACQGLTRRRFLDLGLTPGTVIEPVMQSPLGEPTAYRIRGSRIALRREQADLILVEPVDSGQQTPLESVGRAAS